MTSLELEQRSCVVTGASSGIGEETAVGLARRGARVLLVARSRERGEAALTRTAAAARGEPPELLLADLASLKEVRRLAEEILERCPQLHVLVQNAGVVNLRRQQSVDGHEATFAVNHLAPFLLTSLLLGRLVASAPARIVIVGSEAHRFARLDLGDLDSSVHYGAMRVYGTTKLANLLFTYELARRLEGTGVTANCVHPGAVATRLAHNNGVWARLLTGLLRPVFRTPAQGAETSIWAACSPELEGVSGRYLLNSRIGQSSPLSHDRRLQAELWEASCRLTGPSEEAA